MLSKDGRIWSEDTIKRDLASLQAQEILEELERQQLSDIAFAEGRIKNAEIKKTDPTNKLELSIDGKGI